MTSANFSILKDANWFDARWTLALRDWRVYAAAAIVRLKALAPYALIELVSAGRVGERGMQAGTNVGRSGNCYRSL